MLGVLMYPFNALNPLPSPYICVVDSSIPFDHTVLHDLFFPFRLNIVTSETIREKYIRIKYKLLYSDDRVEVPVNYIFNTLLSKNPYILEISITHFDGRNTKIFSINVPGMIINDDSYLKMFDNNWTKCFMDTSKSKMLGYMSFKEILETYKVFESVKNEMLVSSGFFSKIIIGVKAKLYSPGIDNNILDWNDDDFDEDAKPI